MNVLVTDEVAIPMDIRLPCSASHVAVQTMSHSPRVHDMELALYFNLR